jgi:intracellular multiplication protein IcmO
MDAKPEQKSFDPVALLVAAPVVALVALCALEHYSQKALLRQAAGDTAPVAGAKLMNRYLVARTEVLQHPAFYLAAVLAAAAVLTTCIVLLVRALRRFAAQRNAWMARRAEMEFKGEKYSFDRVEVGLPELFRANPEPDKQVVLGIDPKGAPYHLTDAIRNTHVLIMGQIGSGKTKSAIEPLIFQDLHRGRGLMFLDAKGAEDNEQRFLAMAAAAGRLPDVRILTLNPGRVTHTYNLLHMTPDAQPPAIAERIFSSFEADMDNPYYKGQARLFFTNLVCALAGTGKPFHILDALAATTNPEILDHALQLTSDGAAKRKLISQINQLGKDAPKALTGLSEALQRYDHPAVNAYDPDIVLEHCMDESGVLGFFLPVNYYRYLARYVGIVILQHIQQVGAQRQLDRSRLQTPFGIFADEFYNFAYEQFITSLNMLRDACVNFHLAHQSIADLERVSPEFAAGVLDNCRTKLILRQNNPDLCERLAKSLGTEKAQEMTLRRSADEWMNKSNMLEASTKEVDQYRLHPSRIKMLRTGQGYLLQDADFTALNMQILPPLPEAPPMLLPRRQTKQGLDLYKLLVEGGLGQENALDAFGGGS